MIYSFSVIQTSERDCRDFIDSMRKIEPEWTNASFWGAFQPLFGMASTQMILVHFGNVYAIERDLETLPFVNSVDTMFLQPTVRPTQHECRTKAGICVFRFFDVNNRDVDTITNLSNEAWTYFEGTTEYQAIPQALFAHADLSKPEGKMLLCTWYDNLTSWERSRTPDPRATENFRQRHELTQGTKPFATRLVQL